MTLILVGIIGAFTGLFLSTGIEGFIASKRNSEVALKAQIAMDRLSAELRHVTQVTTWAPTGTPATVRSFLVPWFACTSTPSVCADTRRLAVPIPPLNPWATIPVPPPTSATGRWPARCACTRPMIGIRLPTCRLGAVGSKPQ